MIQRMLSCFLGFQCIAGDCRDSCCEGWEIDVDEESFQRFQSVGGDFGEVLRSSIVTDEDGTHHYRLDGERCPFLRPDGLCQQILTLGEDALCEICTEHPRFHAPFGEIEETGFGIACEEAARMLFASPEPLTLVQDGNDEEPEDESYSFLMACRNQLFSIAQDRTLTIYERLGTILTFADDAQDCLDMGLLSAPELSESFEEITPGMGGSWLDWLTTLEPIDGQWTEALEDALAAAQYPEMMEDFSEEMEDSAWKYENLLVYLLFRYILKAYDDNDLLYWCRAAVFGVLTVETLAFGRWLRNHGALSHQDFEDIARIFSKEIEYDPDIIEGLDVVFEEFPPFSGAFEESEF